MVVTTGYVTHHVPCRLPEGHGDAHRPAVGLPADHQCQRNQCPPFDRPSSGVVRPPVSEPGPASSGSMSLRLARMTEEQQAEMAEWDLILRGTARRPRR